MVAAAVEDGERETALEAPLDDKPVAVGHLFCGQSHLTETVLLVDIGTGDPDHEVGGEMVEGCGERVGEGSEVIVAGDFAGEPDVDVAGFFGAGVIAFAVDRVGENTVIPAEDGMGAVALVGVRVGDEHAERGACFVQVADGNSNVVEHAVAESAVGKGVVRSAGEVGGHAVVEGVMTGRDGGCGFEGRSVEQAWLPGESEFVDLGAIKGAVGEFEEVVAGVDAKELAIRSRCDRADLHGGMFCYEQVVRLWEFFHRERMSRRKRKKEFRMVKAAQARRHGGKDARRELARQTI